jgi:hypothetical protein
MSLLTRAVNALFPGVIFPWNTTTAIQALVYKDLYGTSDGEVVTRASAMRVAPIKRARAVIVGRLADLPLELGEIVDGEFVPDESQPAWLTQTKDIATTPWYRFAWSLDDVLFTGWSLWSVERDGSGVIIDADRIERDRWRFEASSPTGVSVAVGDLASPIWVPITDDRSVILFAGPDDGLLVTAHDTIVGWRHMERAWVGRVRNPIPLIVLYEKDAQNPVTQAEAQMYVDAFATGRVSPNGAIGFLPAKIGLEVHGEAKADLFNEGRNAARIDVANQTNLPVSYLDGSTATASLTYVTQEGDRHALVDDLEYWLAPFESRLSKPDVTGDAKKVIRANRSNLTDAPNDPHGATAREAERTPAAPEPTGGNPDA